MIATFLLALVAGALTALSPCVLPVLPIIVASAFGRHRLGPLAVACGMTLAFTAVGMILAISGSVLGVGDHTIRLFAAILLIVSGALLASARLAGLFAGISAPIAARAQGFLDKHAPQGVAGQFVVGLMLGVVWTPCTGPTLGAAIGLAAQAGTRLQALFVMLAFGIGASAPLLGIAYGARQLFARSREGIIRTGGRGKTILGMILIVVGVFILFGLDKFLETHVLNLLPDWWNDLLSRF